MNSSTRQTNDQLTPLQFQNRKTISLTFKKGQSHETSICVYIFATLNTGYHVLNVKDKTMPIQISSHVSSYTHVRSTSPHEPTMIRNSTASQIGYTP